MGTDRTTTDRTTTDRTSSAANAPTRPDGGPEGCCASVVASPMDEERAARVARRFAALADPVRLRLLSLIAASGEVCSCDLLEPLGRSQPTVSHHTKVLAEAGLIVGDKRGRWVWWRVAPDAVSEVRDALG